MRQDGDLGMRFRTPFGPAAGFDGETLAANLTFALKKTKNYAKRHKFHFVY